VFLKHILNHATAGDPESVLKAVDDYAWSLDESHYVMNIGDTKGKILDSVVSEKQPRLAVEFGTYLGYSAARIARLLPEGGRLISVDTWPGAGAAAAVLLEKAGLSSRVELRTEGSTETLYDLVGAGEKIDLLFLDHDKDQYLHDLQLAISLGVLADGCAIVADKIRFPFTQDYYDFVTHQSAFNTTIHDTLLEYHKHLGDDVLVSTYDEQKRNQTGLLTGRTWLGEPEPSDSEAEPLRGTDSEFDNFLNGLRAGAQGETEPEWESL
jgi:catechol O-methyltransferase